MDVFGVMASYDYGEVHMTRDAATGLRAIVAIHDTRLGPALGGCRFLPYAQEMDALVDVLRLARGMGWQAVLKTRISLGKGDYRLQVDGRGAHLLIDGDIKAVTTEVDPDPLFEWLSKAAVPPKIEAAVRATLEP